MGYHSTQTNNHENTNPKLARQLAQLKIWLGERLDLFRHTHFSRRAIERLRDGSIHSITGPQFETTFNIEAANHDGFYFFDYEIFISTLQPSWQKSNLAGYANPSGPFGAIDPSTSHVIGQTDDDTPIIIDYRAEIPRVLAISDKEDQLPMGQLALVAPSIDSFLNQLGLP